MSFIKQATIGLMPLASGKYDIDCGTISFTKHANKKFASVYQDKPSRIDVRAMLEMVANDYDISADPNDYIFEAARAVTAEVPNENGDGFPRQELLRFNHRLHKAVYQTFIGKPHHINHRADNPKTSRGVVLDASYNDLAPALDACPECGSKTASVEDRDSSGINCKKCGFPVKDEFVELLIAIDRKKDPAFAEGVKNGSLDSLSMGCEAEYTDCSICGNRARTVAQFCNHIRSGNKKKIFKTASGLKMSFERCGGVIFTEISRVDQPADPKAKQREVLSVSVPHQPSIVSFAQRITSPTSGLYKGAQLVDDKLLDQIDELSETHPELYMNLKKLLGDDEGVSEQVSIDDYEKKHQESLNREVSTAEIGIKPELGGLPTTAAIGNKVNLEIKAELDKILASDSNLEESNVSSPGLFAESYHNLEAMVTDKGNVRVFTPRGTLFVVRPEPKLTQDNASKELMSIMSHIAEHGLINTVEKYNAVLSPKIAQVLQYHVEDFTDGRDEGDKKPVTEGGKSDMAESRAKPASDLQSDGELDHQEKPEKPAKTVTDESERDHVEDKAPAKSVLDKEVGDMDEARAKPPKNTLSDVDVDHKDLKPKKAQLDVVSQPPVQSGMPVQSATEKCSKCGKDGCGGKCAEGEKTANPALIAPLMTGVGQGLGQGIADKVGSVEKKDDRHASRLERLYKARLDKVRKESQDKVASAETEALNKLQNKFLRTLKLAARRQALNLEGSPLKAKMFDVLVNRMDLDHESYYPGMDAHTASCIVEATTDSAFDEFVASIVKRASELVAMNDEALTAIEADIKNLKPASVKVEASATDNTARNDVRRAAIDGNLVVAPSSPATNAAVPNGNLRDNIRSALDTTKVRRASQAYNSK